MLRRDVKIYSQGFKRQNGVALFVVLIVLVAMTLAAIALVRSVDTTNIVAGNLAFQQAATNSGDNGTEQAIVWLEQANKDPVSLHLSQLGSGYSATRGAPAATFSWDTATSGTGAITPVTLAADAAGNRVSYIIQRLCDAPGNPLDHNPVTGPNCDKPRLTQANLEGNSNVVNADRIYLSNDAYYRITTRIEGPRNTLSYTQLIAAM
ncbi:hypothetical protein A7981_01155 [Methylovorus sp. MM2]|uniref:pilus assembly PilX family protein n=1 Tax=Methylovorus sp. MM2 TaxID=1848038 RepID=UPI0007DEF4FF|nr:hypothetical protein [Methylovorus sp. MM2]OAM52127.1 hypothetical protein A7981_01155 [Methylovorus sp. MM2]